MDYKVTIYLNQVIIIIIIIRIIIMYSDNMKVILIIDWVIRILYYLNTI